MGFGKPAEPSFVSMRVRPEGLTYQGSGVPAGLDLFLIAHPGEVRKGGEPLLGYFRPSLRDWRVIGHSVTQHGAKNRAPSWATLKRPWGTRFISDCAPRRGSQRRRTPPGLFSVVHAGLACHWPRGDPARLEKPRAVLRRYASQASRPGRDTFRHDLPTPTSLRDS